MASELQYKIFKEVYDEESDRYSSLGTRSNLYLTLITFYLGVILLKVDDVLKFITTFRVPIVLFLVIGLVLVIALFLTVRAMGIRDYEGICDLNEIIEGFGKTPPSDEEFLDDRLVDLAVATNRNSLQNDRVAGLLQWAARLIAFAVILQVIVFAVAITNARSSSHGKDSTQKVAQVTSD